IWPDTCVPTSTVSVAWSVPVLETTDSTSPRVISTNRYPPAASRPVPNTMRARSSTATAPAEPHRIFFFIIATPDGRVLSLETSAARAAGGRRRTGGKTRIYKDLRDAAPPGGL